MTDLIQVGSPFVGPDLGAYSSFGRGAALSRDGLVLAVGAYSFGQGKVFVYDLVNGAWSLRGTLSPPSIWDYEFGIGLALDGDGSTLAVAGTSMGDYGGVYLYDWSGSAWVKRSQMVAPATEDISSFGWSCALSSNGNILAVGCKWDYTQNGAGSSVWLFDWDGDEWIERGSLYNGDALGFGVGVALSGDGSILAVGEDAYSTPLNAQGCVHVYDWSGSAWSQRGSVLVPADAAISDYFGSSVALNNAGDLLAVGAIFWEGSTTNQGGVYLFSYSGSAWSQEGAVLVASDASGYDRFGGAVALSGNGIRLVVGAEEAEGALTNQGQAYFFQGTPAVEIEIGGTLGSLSGALALHHVPPVSLSLASTLGDIQGDIDLEYAHHKLNLDATLAGVAAAIRVLRVVPRADHAASWRMWLRADHALDWSIPLRYPAHASRWQDLLTARRTLTAPWGDCQPVAAEAESPYGDRPRVTSVLALPWSDTTGARRSLSSGYGDRPTGRRSLVHGWSVTPPVSAEHGAAWADGRLPGTAHAVRWAQMPVARSASTATWTDTTATRSSSVASWGPMSVLRPAHWAAWSGQVVARADRSAPWGDTVGLRKGLVSTWADLSPVVRLHSVSWSEGEPRLWLGHRLAWSDRALARGHHESGWASCQTISPDLVAPWGEPLAVSAAQLSAWEDLEPLLAAHRAGWSDRPEAVRSVVSSWADGVPLSPAHQASWSDRAVASLHQAVPWGDYLALGLVTHRLDWSERPLVWSILAGSWADALSAQPSHALPWGDYPALRVTGHHLSWGDRSGARGLLTSTWAESPLVAAAHALAWGESDLRVALSHGLSWGDQAQAKGHHEITWGYAQPVNQALVVSWGDRPRGALSLSAGWSECAVSAPSRHALAWADRPASRATCAASWGAASVSRQASASAWTDAVPASRDHAGGWTDASSSRLTHAAVYADREAAEAAVSASWGQTISSNRAHDASWSLTAPSRRSCTLAWSLKERPDALATHRANWAVLEDVNLISIDNVPEVTWEGRSVQILAARLSADEESPVWIAEEIVIAERELWSAIQLGDLIQFSIHDETWLLRVDGKGMSRPQPGDMLLSISAVSPLAWLDAPYASAITLDNTSGAVSARATVAALVASVGSLTWDLDDWLIPAGALVMSETTPLQAAREIVAAIGGLLESAPDGTPVARRRHPVSVPAYATASPDQVIQDGDLFAFQVSAAPFAGFNRVVITNEDLNSEDARDRLEYFDEDDNPYDGEMRAWPNPWRPAVLGHTGHPDTEITALGERQHSHTELVEFVAGQGRVKYPVHTLTSVQWQHVDLGSVAADGTDLTATVGEQSLAWITYTTRTLDWRVGLDRDESVQFVLI